jgi:2-polyprenyl-3-methyl-5-hydroxy-6-metoxy-1,4-benzoquinol methylase
MRYKATGLAGSWLRLLLLQAALPTAGNAVGSLELLFENFKALPLGLGCFSFLFLKALSLLVVLCRYKRTTAEDLAASGALFDVVVASEVIEHVRKPADFLAVLAQLARPGGQVIISTLNRTPASYALAIVGAEYVTGLVPRGTHNWKKFLTPQELAMASNSAGLVMEHCAGMEIRLTGRDLVLTDSLDVNYIVQFTKVVQQQQ